MTAAASPGIACAHPRLRATEYDESYRWVVSCRDCGHKEPVSSAEWRRRMRGSRRAPVLVGDEGADSGRLTSLACLS